MDSSNNLRKRLYQNLLNKQPKQNHLLGSDSHTKSAILKPKVALQAMNTTAKVMSPVFNKGKIMLQNRIKSPQVPKKIAPIPVKDKISKQGKAIIEQGKLKSKANLKPHDIFAFYEAFPQMSEDFFYLNRVTHPYDYQIVTYSQRNPMQYMTISFKGVTLYHEKQAQFLTKQEWLADEKIYFSLQKIDFFKQYKISKNFTIWKNRMRRHYMKQMSNLLHQNLFLSYDHPRHCLLEIRRATNNLKDDTYFMPTSTIESLQPNEFKKNAEEYIEHTFVQKLKQTQNIIANHLEEAITEQIKKFKLQNNIKINDVGDYDQKQQKQGYVYSQQAILRKQYKKVNRLIKLADGILVQSKIQLLNQCLLQLVQRIQQVNNSDSKSQWIKCTAQLVQSENPNNPTKKIQWNPTLQGLKDIFKDIISLAVTKMSDIHQKIGSRQKFQKYRSVEENQNRKDEKRNTLKYIIQESSFYTRLINQINSYLEEEFKKTEKQQNQLSNFISIYTKHKSLPEVKQIFRLHSASEYIQLVREWREDDTQMHSLPMNKSGGLLVFDYSSLRSVIHDVPKKTLTSFLGQLPQETKKKYNDLVRQSQLHLEQINNYPINMEQFVQFNQAVKKATSALEDLIEGSKALIQMVALIEQNKSPSSDFNRINPKKAIQNISKLKAKVDESNAKYDQSLSKFKKQLESRVSRVKTNAKQLLSKFEVIPFDNISSQIGPTLQRLYEIFPSIQKSQQEALAIQQIQWQLSLPTSELDEIHSLYKNSIDVKNLWECKQKWNELLLQIFHKHYKQINCIELKNRWEQFSKRNTELLKTLPDNEVLKKLIGQISQFQNLLQIIAALTSPNLQEKSWRQISQYLAYQLNIEDEKALPFSNRDDPQYTVEWLINKNISLYKEKISFIVQKSQKQKQLQASLAEFRTFISSIVFETVTKKREVVLIQKNETLHKNIKQKISTLYSLIRNQYSDNLKNQAEIMIKHYEYLEEIMEGMYTFRDEWQKYEPFFENNAVSSKLLTKQAKQFSSWQLQWKKIIKSITNDPAYFYRKISDQTLGVNCSRAMLKTITKANMFLDLVKKGMEQFLQKKRSQFPRYCLFTDQELISILSKMDNRHLIVPEIITILYDNIKSIEYDEESGAVLSVKTQNDERFPLFKQSAYKMQSEMQDLLKITEDQIKKSIAHTIRSTFGKYIEEEISRQSLLTENLIQVALQVDFIAWVRLAEETYLINQPVGTMDDWLNIQEQQIKETSLLMKNSLPKYYFKYTQFMVQSIYFRQKTMSLKTNNIIDTSFYEWQRIPKMIMTNNDIHLRQLDNKISYNYELLNQKQIVVIQSQTEKVWINLISAISNKQGKTVIGLRGNDIESVKDLAFYVGQSIRSIHFSETCNIKTVQKFLTGCMHIGFWMHFAPIKNPQILSYIAYHINANKRATNFQSMSSTLQLTKTTSLNNFFSNAIFLFESGEDFVKSNLIDSKNFRNVTLHKPNQKLTISILCEALKIPQQIGNTLLKICEFCRQSFKFSKSITTEFLKNTIKQIKESFITKFSENEIKDLDILNFIPFYVISQRISTYFSTIDYQLFHAFKTSFLPNYQTLKVKFSHRFQHQNSHENHPVNKYLKSLPDKHFFSKQFIHQASKAYDTLNDNSKLGLILSGQILSGKSQIISFIESVLRFQMKYKEKQFQVFKLYPNAYKSEEIIKTYTQEKKDRSQKLDKSNQDLGILQSFLVRQTPFKWIIIDGRIQKGIFQFLNHQFQETLVPNYGLISKQKSKKENLQKVKIIVETLNSCEFSPSSFYNYSLCHVSSSGNQVESLVKSFFQKKKVKKYLKSLSEESFSYIEQQLILNLTKVEQKGNIKSKSLQFIYPFADNEIAFKCLKLVQSIFKLNQESIRQKEKNMKKTIQKFVHWSICVILHLHVQVQNQSKLEKRYVQVCKCQNIFHESINQYIVYPGSGIQVHLINGLRTQSSLFEIPQKGIVTSITNTDFNEFNNFMNQRANKFYEQISLQTVSTIRVNHEGSNLFNYYSQLFAYSNIPMVLTGPAGTGKKSIFQLYAKNIKHRAFVHSIRYNRNQPLLENFQKHFRKYHSLEGVVLKSPLITKDTVILIDDLNLVQREKQTLQFFRMLLNENGFVNKSGKVKKLTEGNNNFSILSNLIDPEESVVRLCARLMFFQTSQNSSQKLTSIFAPFLKAWSKANSLQGQVDRIFTSSNGDTLLDATLKIFQFMEDAFKQKKSQKDYSLNTLLLKPRIGDIGRVLSCICLTQDANKMTLGYYSDLWANEIMRVFQDRLSPSQKDISKNLMDVVRKQFFLKFKENFQYNPKQLFIFSSYLSGQNRFYERMYDLQNLQQMIENAYQSQTITVPVKLFFSQLLKQILKIYRVLEITHGHMILFHINKNVRHYLIELASQVAQAPLLHMKKNILTPQKDIIAILEYQEDISIFQDLDDITEEQIYQFTCLVNKNNFDFDLKPQTREKIKIKITKYLRQLLNEISIAKQNISQSQKSNVNTKDKQNLYINQKLEQDLQSTMQEIMMNSVHFLFGASPMNPKTKKLILNETDLVGKMHFSFFDIADQSMMEISKQILILEDENQSMDQSQKIEKVKLSPKQLQKQAQIIMSKCLKIYNSLPEPERDFNALLNICENITADRQKLKQQTQNHIKQLEKCIQNYKKALQLISQNQTKLEKSINQLQEIKKQQSFLSQKLQQKTNEINEIQLNINQNEEGTHENSQKKLLLQQKNQQLQAVENQLREIKMKKDKNDVQTRQARKMIQLSRDYIEIVMDLSQVQKKLQYQKQIFENIQNILILWWSMIIFSSNKDTQEIILQLNQWIQLIGFKSSHQIKHCQDIMSMFEIIIAPLSIAIPALGSISSQNKFRVLILMYIIYRHSETTSQNRITTLYDPSKVFASILKFFPIESQLGNFTFAQTIHKYDENFWAQIQKHKRGLIFLDQSIDQRQKKQIQSHMIKRRLFQLNRFISLVDKKQKADVSFIFEKDYFINYLKLLSMLTDDTSAALELIQIREDYIKETRKLKEMKKNLRSKLADIKFEMQTDTEELSRYQRDIGLLQSKISQHQVKVSLKNLKVTEERIIIKIINQLHENLNLKSNNFKNNPHDVFNLHTIQKLYRTIRENVLRFVSDLREKTEALQKKNLLQMPVPKVQVERKSIRPSMNAIQIPSQFIESLSKSQFEFSKEQQEKVDVMIQKLIKDNFSEERKVEKRDLFNVDFLSLQILSRVPIVVVQNSLPNQFLISRDNKPINLLYSSFSNVVLQPITSNSNEERTTLNNKVFLFYNDELHCNALIQLVNKYLDDFHSTDKKHCIYLFTNMPLNLLVEGQNKQGSNYKIFYCQKDKMSKPSSSEVNLPLNQKSTKTQIYIKTIEHLTSSKLYNQSQIQKYTQFLLSKVPPNIDQSLSLSKTELKNYLLDVSLGLSNEQTLIQRILNDQITLQDINLFIQKYHIDDFHNKARKTQQCFKNTVKKEIQLGNFELKTQFTSQIFEQISQELPNIFNLSQFLVPLSKDNLSFEFQNLAKIFNVKLKKVKSLLQKNLKAYTLSSNRLSDSCFQQGLYLLPTSNYIIELNKQYRTIKKILIQNGLLGGSSSSMAKIVSTKGLGTHINPDSSKHGMFLDQYYFNMRILNQFKVRACKKLKINYSRLGLLFIVQRKSQTLTYSTSIQKLITNTSPQILLSFNAELINAQLKNSTPLVREEKEPSRVLHHTKKEQSKMLRLLVIPYDLNSFTDTQNYFNLALPTNQFNMSMKKKTIFGQTILKKEETMKEKLIVETLKLKLFLSSQRKQEGKINCHQKQLGVVEIPSNQVFIEHQGILVPLVEICHKSL